MSESAGIATMCLKDHNEFGSVGQATSHSSRRIPLQQICQAPPGLEVKLFKSGPNGENIEAGGWQLCREKHRDNARTPGAQEQARTQGCPCPSCNWRVADAEGLNDTSAAAWRAQACRTKNEVK